MGRRSQPGSPSLSQTMGHPVPKTDFPYQLEKKPTGLLPTPSKSPTSFKKKKKKKKGRKKKAAAQKIPNSSSNDLTEQNWEPVLPPREILHTARVRWGNPKGRCLFSPRCYPRTGGLVLGEAKQPADCTGEARPGNQGCRDSRASEHL